MGIFGKKKNVTVFSKEKSNSFYGEEGRRFDYMNSPEHREEVRKALNRANPMKPIHHVSMIRTPDIGLKNFCAVCGRQFQSHSEYEAHNFKVHF